MTGVHDILCTQLKKKRILLFLHGEVTVLFELRVSYLFSFSFIISNMRLIIKSALALRQTLCLMTLNRLQCNLFSRLYITMKLGFSPRNSYSYTVGKPRLCLLRRSRVLCIFSIYLYSILSI